MPDKKVALITGASRGLGRSMAGHLARAGVAVLGTYKSGAEQAKRLEAEVAESGGELAFIPFDVSHFDRYADLVDRVRQTVYERFASRYIDYLVNNAGTGTFASYEQTTTKQFDELVTVDLKAPFFTTQVLLPVLRDGGRILNVSTALTRGVVPGMSAYAAVKGALEVLTRYQAAELADRQIRVNTIMGGAVDTDFGDGMMHSKHVQDLCSRVIALGRIGTADDVGAAVPAILSDAFGWANGGCIELTGGQSL